MEGDPQAFQVLFARVGEGHLILSQYREEVCRAHSRTFYSVFAGSWKGLRIVV